MKTTMQVLIVTLCVLSLSFICFTICKREIDCSNTNLKISIVTWHEHRSIYHAYMYNEKKSILTCKRPVAFLAFLLIITSGDIQTNPGPIKYPCGVCSKPVAKNHRALECDSCTYWVHIKCGGITPSDYQQFQKNKHLSWECPNCLLPNVTDSFFLADDIDISHNSFQSLSDINTDEEEETINSANQEHQSKYTKSKGSTIRLLNMNCRSLRSESKRQQFISMIDLYKPHIIHATETHLDKQISSSEILDPEFYDIYRKDRTFQPGHEGGGVLNAVRKDLISSGEVTLDTDCEISWNKIQVQGSKPLYTGCFYRQPNNEAVSLQKLDESLGRLTHNQNLPNIVLTGDFNIPDIQWKDSYSIRSPQQYNLEVNETILNITNEHNLEQQNITQPRTTYLTWFSPPTKIS
ncbi:Hypothetical predicted protein [Mytilus galloprovincialis]|uniref:PHD-type domain-containing protein n=1 Tax=Mytilus galloprovincialis TaxID=29158 RepID=A0A8B6CCI0_MYTGA|nr:Hypothetical predicted protein [Mytilus galloprovincialis]